MVDPPPSSCTVGVCPMKKKDKSTDLDKSVDLNKSCPNSDPNFNRIIGDDRTPDERSNLYIVCVITRALLYSGVYIYRDQPWMTPLVGALATASVYQLTRPTENRQWWSKNFQLVMAILVLGSAIAVKFAGLDSRSMALLLFISLAGGVLQRSQIKMC